MNITKERITSKCGIDCDSCNYKESTGCIGCVNIEKVFWGECSVKICCEEKKLENCGYCNEFPCDLLKSFSYAENEHGDNGERIERCKLWCKKNSNQL